MPSGGYIALPPRAETDIPTAESGYQNFFVDADDSNNPAVKDDAGVVTSMKGDQGDPGDPGAAGADAFPLDVVVHGNCGATETFDYGTGAYVAGTSGQVHSGTVNADLTITLATSTASGKQAVLELILTEDGTGDWTITLPASVTNKTAVEAQLVLTAGAVNRLILETTDGGTSWLGMLVNATGPAGADGVGVPAGGTTGQMLAKIDGTDYNTEWVNPGAGSLSGTAIAPSSDTYINQQAATTNSDSSTTLLVGNKWGTASFTRFALLTFDISALAGKTVYGAFVQLTRTDALAETVANTVLQARRVLRAYNPTQVTWNVYSTGNNWTTAGAESAGNDVGAEAHGSTPVMNSPAISTNIFRLDITRLVQEEIDASSTTLRIILGMSQADGSLNVITLASLEHATAAYRPKLHVVYA